MSSGLSCQVMIVGGGPVGLLLANLLGERGLDVLLAEKRARLPVQSMAIGITPTSLEILRRLGLHEAISREGIRIATARVYENGILLGSVDFSGLDSDFRYMLSLPQRDVMGVLRQRLAQYPCVRCLDGTELLGLVQTGFGVKATLSVDGAALEILCGYMVGCDGHDSRVRECLGVRTAARDYAPSFLMADVEDRTDLGSVAHLYFGARGSVESFPLPGGFRRWIVMADRRQETELRASLIQKVAQMAGFDLAPLDVRGLSRFQPRRLLVSRYFAGRAVLCGDAAHVMSPIGGQGMNTGFADAEMLAPILVSALAHPAGASALFQGYDRVRRRAFRIAAARAARGMWLGTRTGVTASRLRGWFIREVLLGPRLRPRLPPYFAMLTIPNCNLARAGTLPRPRECRA